MRSRGSIREPRLPQPQTSRNIRSRPGHRLESATALYNTAEHRGHGRMEKSPEPRPPRVTDRPGRQRSPMIRHRSSKPATLLLLLALLPWSPPSAAALGTTLKAWLRLGKYRETVATKVATLHPHGDIWGLAFSPDGRLLAASSPHTGSVQLWDWRHDRLVRRLQKAPGWDIMATTPLAFSPDGRLLASWVVYGLMCKFLDC